MVGLTATLHYNIQPTANAKGENRGKIAWPRLQYSYNTNESVCHQPTKNRIVTTQAAGSAPFCPHDTYRTLNYSISFLLSLRQGCGRLLDRGGRNALDCVDTFAAAFLALGLEKAAGAHLFLECPLFGSQPQLWHTNSVQSTSCLKFIPTVLIFIFQHIF